MSEPVKFEYTASLTTKYQQGFIKVLAKHLRLPEKVLRNALNKERSEKYGILAFNSLDCPINEEYYVASCPKLGLQDFVTEKKFNASKFVAEKTLMNSVMERMGSRFVIATPALWVQANIHEISDSSINGGAIYINYPGFKDEMIVPLELYLKKAYPLSD